MKEEDKLQEKIQELIYDIKILISFTIFEFITLILLFLMVFGFIIISF